MSGFLSFLNSGLAIVVVLGLCLLFHEFGHFITAKLCRMRVYEFSMGFGPLMWQRTRGETAYSIRAIPFGGFVQIAGMEPGDDATVERGFYTRPRWQRVLVVIAGSLMNIVLAILVYWVANIATGQMVENSNAIIIKSTFKDSVARAANLQPGDQIVGVDGSRHSTLVEKVIPGSIAAKMGLREDMRVFQIGDRPIAIPGDVVKLLAMGLPENEKVWVTNPEAKDLGDAIIPLEPPSKKDFKQLPAGGNVDDTWAQKALGVTFGEMDQNSAQRAISARPGQLVALDILRKKQLVKVTLTPNSDTDRVEMVDATGKLDAPHRTVGRIGIILGGETRPTGLFEGLKMAVAQSISAVAMVVISLKAMILGQVAAEPTGPIGIMAMTAETAKLGWGAVLGLCGMISANLAVINMAPIPPFDGFHVILLLIEGVIGKRINQKFEFAVRAAGFVLIIGLFMMLAAKDILNLAIHGTY